MEYLNSQKFKSILSYILIFLFSCLAGFLLFYDGIAHGHDTDFHFSNIYDAYYNIKTGHFSPISANLASGVGVGKGLFYAPLPHYTVGLVGVLLEPFGISLLDSLKIVLFFTIFISGIFTYRIGIKMSNGKSTVGLIAAAFYICFPYRLFDIFIRMAFAEAFSFLFLPLFFLGLYNLAHMEKENIRPLPFLEIILGAAGLFLSHNLTAMVAYILGFIYLIIYIDRIVPKLKNKKYLLYVIITALLIVGLCSVNLFSQLEYLSSNIYNISIGNRMHTSREEVMKRVDTYYVYSGFLNRGYLDYAYNMFIDMEYLNNELILFISFTIGYLLIDNLLKLIKVIKNYTYFPLTIIYLLLVGIFITRLEAVASAIIISFIYLLAEIEDERAKISFYKNRDFYYLLFFIPFLIYMIVYPTIWKYAPEFMLKLQFPWRLWAFVQLFGALLLGLLGSKLFNRRIGYGALAIASGIMLMLNQSTIEKRLDKIYPEDNDNKIWPWEKEINKSFLTHPMSMGASAEYLPSIYYYGQTNYKSEYANSLYNSVNYEVFYQIGKNPYSLEPVALEGSSVIRVIAKEAPIYEMEITVEEDALIQVPLIYYAGYEIEIMDINTNKLVNVDAKEIDGLVSFSLQEGSYKCKTVFKGTRLRRAGVIIRYISYAATIAFIIYIPIENRKRKAS